jgi:hypothetical protein
MGANDSRTPHLSRLQSLIIGRLGYWHRLGPCGVFDPRSLLGRRIAPDIGIDFSGYGQIRTTLRFLGLRGELSVLPVPRAIWLCPFRPPSTLWADRADEFSDYRIFRRW